MMLLICLGLYIGFYCASDNQEINKQARRSKIELHYEKTTFLFIFMKQRGKMFPSREKQGICSFCSTTKNGKQIFNSHQTSSLSPDMVEYFNHNGNPWYSHAVF